MGNNQGHPPCQLVHADAEGHHENPRFGWHDINQPRVGFHFEQFGPKRFHRLKRFFQVGADGIHQPLDEIRFNRRQRTLDRNDLFNRPPQDDFKQKYRELAIVEQQRPRFERLQIKQPDGPVMRNRLKKRFESEGVGAGVLDRYLTLQTIGESNPVAAANGVKNKVEIGNLPPTEPPSPNQLKGPDALLRYRRGDLAARLDGAVLDGRKEFPNFVFCENSIQGALYWTTKSVK
ncbi:MAG: hypothetical protein A2X84_14515 [Desulfuromonadaceae bacterium GWC2_58_13]|nr:MAG: hypothetical protein A2X84_14515 [Desulfuromonadaceae bacterium GWC2_58_13]